MEWNIEYVKEAQRDLKRLDSYNRKIILKAIGKTAERPLPPPDGIGKPIGNHAGSKLCGYYKIKLCDSGYRVVYQPVSEGETMRMIVISVRDDETVYKEAEQRIWVSVMQRYRS